MTRPPFEPCRELADAALDLRGVAQADRRHFDAERAPQRLNGAELRGAGGIAGIAEHRRAHCVGCDLPQQLQPFAADVEFEIAEPGGVAAGVRQALHKPEADRVSDLDEHDRDSVGEPAAAAPHGSRPPPG